MSKMTLREALEILIESAKRDLSGAGCGIGHSVPEGRKRESIEDAIERAEEYIRMRNLRR